MAFTMNGAPQTQNNYQRKPFQPFSAQSQYRTPYRAYGNRPYQTSYQQGGIYQPYRPQNFPSYPSQLHPPPAAPRKQQMFQTYPQMTSKSLPANPVTEAINPQSPEEDQELAPIRLERHVKSSELCSCPGCPRKNLSTSEDPLEPTLNSTGARQTEGIACQPPRSRPMTAASYRQRSHDKYADALSFNPRGRTDETKIQEAQNHILDTQKTVNNNITETLLLPANGTDPGAPAKKRSRPLGSRTKRVQSLPVIRDTIPSRLRLELRRGSQNPPVVYREPESTDNRTEGDTPDDSDDVFLPPNGNGGKSGRIEPPKDPIRELAPATYFDSDDDGDDEEKEGGGGSRTSVNESIKKFERIAKKFGNVKGVAPPWIWGTTELTYLLPADPLWVPFTKTPPNKQVVREVRKSINEPLHQLNITSDDEEDQTITAPNNLEHDTDTTEHENEITELLDEENNIENDKTSTASEPDDTVIPTETNEPSLPKSLTVTEENIRLAPETPTLIRTMLNNFETQGIH
ncbi:hypothetical protein KQX54_013270 [Cotesia glomerata]|uniref:Uncharacterized protein n=1 Tax=Cotesia glomerata TaxID=32391 RepID=A0AAV7I5Z2_COTGL|nr:hypothetical protein KQX54_013270 [Cotesia glomerata]